MKYDNFAAIIFVPETAPGRGTGHLKRCLAFAGHSGPDCPASFVLPPADRERCLRAFPDLAGFPLHESAAGVPDLSQTLVILDKPCLTPEEVRTWLPASRVLALDALGPGLELVPFLVDLLPRLRLARPRPWALPNRHEPGILFAPRPVRPAREPLGPLRLAVSFGGEDPAGLRAVLLDSGLLQACFPAARVDLVRGPASPPLGRPLPAGWQETGPFAVLADQLAEYDLLVTSFGLTALEARARGLPQVHLNPTAYHQKLSRQEGFLSLGIRKPDRQARQLLQDLALNLANPVSPEAQTMIPPAGQPESTGQPTPTIPAQSQPPLADFPALVTLCDSGTSHRCPACRGVGNRVINRQPGRSFFACATCGITYQTLLGDQTVSYSEAYFFDEYKAQYGKTYLEDFDHIKAMGTGRVRVIRQLAGPGPASLLDIGCAYGPFMAAAREAGFQPRGCDINPQAVAHIRDQLGMPAWNLDFRQPDAPLDPPVYDVVTLWYVIEHFADLEPVLSRLACLVRPGGILALATPSGQGISARARLAGFLSASPRDHYTIWNPARAGQLLARHGFHVVKTRSTGHHPERFPGLWGRPAFRPLSLLASRLFGLGDTFELYARRIQESGQSGPGVQQ